MILTSVTIPRNRVINSKNSMEVVEMLVMMRMRMIDTSVMMMVVVVI